MELLFVLLISGIILFILGLFYRKLALQMQYLQIQKKKPKEALKNFLFFDWSDAKARSLRTEAFLLFPMLYPIVLDDKNEELLDIKHRIKRHHIGIYFGIIFFIVLSIFSEKVF